MQELKDHYDSTSQGAQRKQVARAYPKKIFYNNENNFTFEKYVAKLKGFFNVLGNIVSHSIGRRWLSIY